MKARGSGFIYQPTYAHGGVSKTASTWWIQYSIRGRRVRENSHGTQADAAKLLRRRIGEVATGKPTGPSIDKTTLNEICEMLLNDYKANGLRVNSIIAAIRHLKDFFGETCRCIDLTADRVTGYIAQRLELGAKPATVNRSLAALRRGFRLAVIAGKAATPPIITLLSEAGNTRTGFFERADFEAVVQHLPGYVKAAVQTGYITGWRVRSEILTRRKPHLDLDAGWLRLDPGESKNKQGRMFPLTPELRQILEAQVERNREYERATGTIVPWLFHHNGKPIICFTRAWRGACAKAGVPGRLPHDMRRTAVRNLERAGVPRSTAMRLTGHKTEAVYRRYAIVDEAMLREGIDKLGALHDLERNTETARKVVPIRPTDRTAQEQPKIGAIG